MDWFGWLSKTGLDPALVYQYGLEFTRNELQAEDLPHFDHEFLQSMGISVAKHRLEILKVARKDAVRSGGRHLSGLVNAIHRTKRSVGKYIRKLISNNEVVTAKEPHEPKQIEVAKESWRVALTRKFNMDKDHQFQEDKLARKQRSLALSGPLDGNFQHKYLTAAPAAHKSPRLSGPLVYGPRSPFLSGPLDMKSHEKAMLALRSPRLSGPLDGWGAANRSPNPLAPGDGWPAANRSRKFPSRSLRVSGPLEGAVQIGPRSSPRVHGNGRFETERTMDEDGFDEHSLWAKLFHDMKPT